MIDLGFISIKMVTRYYTQNIFTIYYGTSSNISSKLGEVTFWRCAWEEHIFLWSFQTGKRKRFDMAEILELLHQNAENSFLRCREDSTETNSKIACEQHLPNDRNNGWDLWHIAKRSYRWYYHEVQQHHTITLQQCFLAAIQIKQQCYSQQKFAYTMSRRLFSWSGERMGDKFFNYLNVYNYVHSIHSKCYTVQAAEAG